MRGDIVFYDKTSNRFFDYFIRQFTNGPYVHCEIDLGDGNFVGDLPHHGLTVHPDDNPNGKRARPTSVYGLVGIGEGIKWVQGRIDETRKSPRKHGYGYLDIVSDFFHHFGSQVILGQKGHWDCSDFVTHYLIYAGASEPLGDLADTPELVSPNDLARSYGILAPIPSDWEEDL